MTYRVDVSEGNGSWERGTLVFPTRHEAQEFAEDTYLTDREYRVVPDGRFATALYGSPDGLKVL